MGTTQGKIHHRKLGVSLREDNIKIYLNRREVVEATHLGHYMVWQRATEEPTFHAKRGIPLPDDRLPAYGGLSPLRIPLVWYLVTSHMPVITYVGVLHKRT
jgi:hypothetical protein